MPPSTPSGPPGRPTDPAAPNQPWPVPEPADVLHYAYLWSREHDSGHEEATKDRPVVVVIARIAQADLTELLVAPIAHSPPRPGEGIELPQPIERRLGLDDARSLIVTTEMNRFVWPGPDIRPVPSEEAPLYGVIPAGLYEALRTEIVRNATANNMRMPKRSE